MSNPSRQKFSSRHFVVPVVLYAIIFNLPKFFELKTSCTIPERPFSNRYNFQLDRKETKFASVPQWCHLLRSILKCLKTAVSRAGPVVQMSTRRFNWRRARFEQTVGMMTIIHLHRKSLWCDCVLYRTITHDDDNKENPQVLKYLHALAVHHLQHYPSDCIPRTSQHFHNQVNIFFFIPCSVLHAL